MLQHREHGQRPSCSCLDICRLLYGLASILAWNAGQFSHLVKAWRLVVDRHASFFRALWVVGLRWVGISALSTLGADPIPPATSRVGNRRCCKKRGTRGRRTRITFRDRETPAGRDHCDSRNGGGRALSESHTTDGRLTKSRGRYEQR